MRVLKEKGQRPETPRNSQIRPDFVLVKIGSCSYIWTLKILRNADSEVFLCER
jgi:hypothetical protein